MKSILYKVLKTEDHFAAFIARVVMGVVIFPHGAQKILGIWGGHGLQPVVDSFEQWFGIPPFITLLVALGEFVGGLMLVFGLLSRVAAGSVILIMLGAIYFVVHSHFFMNWYSEPRGEGFEFHLLMIGLGVVVLLLGSGKWSLDQFILKRFYKNMSV